MTERMKNSLIDQLQEAINQLENISTNEETKFKYAIDSGGYGDGYKTLRGFQLDFFECEDSGDVLLDAYIQ